MASETISFRLSTVALAKGLVAIRRLDPEYRPVSIHRMVQLVYYDYCAKMSIGHSDEIPPEIFREIDGLLHGNKKRVIVQGDRNILEKLDVLMETAPITQSSPVEQSAPVEKRINVEQRIDVESIPAGLIDDVVTESEKNVVQDFSFLSKLGTEMEDNND